MWQPNGEKDTVRHFFDTAVFIPLKMMRTIRGVVRLTACLLVALIGGPAIVVAAFLPLKVDGYPVAFSVMIRVVDLLVYCANFRVEVTDSERLSRFAGFLLSNHVSYLDILVLVEAVPARFLAKNKIRYWPFVGQAAQAIGCVFVARRSRKSRAKARDRLRQVGLFPPIIVFPEGKRGPGDALLPFRYGVFEIAVEGEIPILPLALVYDRIDIVQTRQESIWVAYWRLLSNKERIVATVHVMDEIRPLQSTNPIDLSHDVHDRMNQLLNTHQYNKDAFLL